MKGFIRKINSDKIIKLSSYMSLGLLSIHIIYIIFYYTSLPPFIPIYNQMPWGEDRIGIKIEILLPFIISMSFFLLNLILSIWIYEKMPLLSRILSITGLLICILSLIFIVRTINLIT
jgi:hypothetical protein